MQIGQIRAGHSVLIKDELVCFVLIRTSLQIHASISRPSKFFINQLRPNTGWSQDEWLIVMPDKDWWWDLFCGIQVIFTTWWWRWWWRWVIFFFNFFYFLFLIRRKFPLLQRAVLYMCEYVRSNLYWFMHTYIFIHLYTFIYIYIYIYMYIYIYACVCGRVCVCACLCEINTHTHTHIYIYMCVCVCVCVLSSYS